MSPRQSSKASQSYNSLISKSLLFLGICLVMSVSALEGADFDSSKLSEASFMGRYLSLSQISWMCRSRSIHCTACATGQCSHCLFNQIHRINGRFRCTTKRNSIPHCMEESWWGNEGECDECDNGYYYHKDQNKCLKGNIKHCKIYEDLYWANDPVECKKCGDHHFWNGRLKRCAPIPHSKRVSNCALYDYREGRSSADCELCRQGYSLDNNNNKCIKECIKGCMKCWFNGSSCFKCDEKRFFYETKRNFCTYKPLPRGHTNSLLEWDPSRK